jgi:hypothetical protein
MNIHCGTFNMRLKKIYAITIVICMVLLIKFIYHECKTHTYYANINSISVEDYLVKAKTGDILFTEWNYIRPKFMFTRYVINMIHFHMKKIPFSHVAVIIHHEDIPESYRRLWHLTSPPTSGVYVYSSEATEYYDHITQTIKEGPSLRSAEDYIRTYNGVVTVLARAPDIPAPLDRACAHMHAHRRRLFNRNILRYFNVGMKTWENAYDPARSLCVETCFEFLKKMDKSSNIALVASADADLLDILQFAEASGNYGLITRIRVS